MHKTSQQTAQASQQHALAAQKHGKSVEEVAKTLQKGKDADLELGRHWKGKEKVSRSRCRKF